MDFGCANAVAADGDNDEDDDDDDITVDNNCDSSAAILLFSIKCITLGSFLAAAASAASFFVLFAWSFNCFGVIFADDDKFDVVVVFCTTIAADMSSARFLRSDFVGTVNQLPSSKSAGFSNFSINFSVFCWRFVCFIGIVDVDVDFFVVDDDDCVLGCTVVSVFGGDGDDFFLLPSLIGDDFLASTFFVVDVVDGTFSVLLATAVVVVAITFLFGDEDEVDFYIRE